MKMLVVNSWSEKEWIQEQLGAEWLVITYDQGRVGQRVDTILFCRSKYGIPQEEIDKIRKQRDHILHALKPEGKWAILP